MTARRGEPGNTRSIGLSILWAILTLGIYTYVWTYKTHEEIERYSGDGIGGVLGFVVYLLVSPVTFFVVPSEVRRLYERDGATPPVRGLTALWVLPPLRRPFVQDAFSRYRERAAGGR